MSDELSISQMLDAMQDAGDAQGGYDSKGFNDWEPPDGTYNVQCIGVRPFMYKISRGKNEGKQVFGLGMQMKILNPEGIPDDDLEVNEDGDVVFEFAVKTIPDFSLRTVKEMLTQLDGTAPDDWKEGMKRLADVVENATFEVSVTRKPSKDGQQVYVNYKFLNGTAA